MNKDNMAFTTALNRHRFLTSCGILVLSSLMPATVAFAQTNESATEKTPTATLETIIVTAQKRAENLQDVPISMNAVTSDTLSDLRIQSPKDLQIKVPSLKYNELVGFGLPYIRGVGSDITMPNADAAVATYVDGIYNPSTYGLLTNMLGVERVEILAGPQGTLYGRNAVGGAINIYTLTPGDHLEVSAKLTGGNYALKEGSFAVSGPVTDNLSIGFYGAGSKRHTFLKRPFRPATEPKDVSQYGGRFKFAYDDHAWLKLTGSIEYLRMETPEASAYQQTEANAVGYIVGGAPVIIAPYTTSHEFPNDFRGRQLNGVLQEEIDLEWATLRGITGYRRNRTDNSADYDATLSPTFAFAAPGNYSNQWSQELQLVSPDTLPWKWLAGLYVGHEQAFQRLDFRSSFALAPFDDIKTYGNVTTKTYAAFGQVTLPVSFISNDMNFTAGLRYTIDKKRFHGEQNLFLPGGIFALNLPGVVDKKKWTDLSPKFTLDYKWCDTLFYVTYSEGYKSGLYNIGSPGAPGPINPEYLTAWEVGSKSALFDNRVNLNTAAYHYIFEDMQVQTVSPTALASTILQNAARAELYGVEANFDALVTDELTISGSVALEHTRYKSFPFAVGFTPAFTGFDTISLNAQGNKLPAAPKFVGSLGFNYVKEMSFGGTLKATGNIYHNGGYFYDNQNVVKQKAYTLVDGTIGYELPNSPVTVSVWASNLFDERYSTLKAINGFGGVRYDAPPRMFGVSLEYKLN